MWPMMTDRKVKAGILGQNGIYPYNFLQGGGVRGFYGTHGRLLAVITVAMAKDTRLVRFLDNISFFETNCIYNT